jgi:hypothetical protein
MSSLFSIRNQLCWNITEPLYITQLCFVIY